MNFLRRRRPSNDSEFTPTRNKSRKPPNTAFRQQRLKSWQPILTPKAVIPFLLVIALIFTPLGIAIIFTTYNVQNIKIDYSHCDSVATSEFANIPSKYLTHHFKSSTSSDSAPKWRLSNETDANGFDFNRCSITFSVPNNINPPVFLYYEMTNFFQNHRKYVQSYDMDQLDGSAVSEDDLSSYCSPFKTNDDGKIYYPCGLIANSYFNDTFYSPVLLNARTSSDNVTYEMSNKDIAWSTDRSRYKKTEYNVSDIVPPPNWYKMYPNGYTDENLPDLSEWESLQNWMRTAGLPKFMKLALKNTTSPLESGTYQLDIDLNYPVSIFGGTKSIMLTDNSIFGGRNLALGIIYLVIAAISLILSIVFLVQHLIKPRKIGDHNYLTDNGPTTFREQL